MTCSSIGTYSTIYPKLHSDKYADLYCLLIGLADNDNNLILAKNVRDAVFTLWERVDEITVPDVLYTNTDLVPTTIGGVEQGLSFSNVPVQQMWDLLLYPELEPTLTNPFSSFTSSVSGLREVGEDINIIFTSNFDRGSISPQYTSLSPFRSGLPVSYQYNGPQISGTYNNNNLIDIRNVVDYEVGIGTQSWNVSVNYSVGVQPKTSKNNDFSFPLPSGSTPFITISIMGVYPYFATSDDITILTKQPLFSPTDEYFEFELVVELGGNKQTFQIPDPENFTPTGIQQFNGISGQWEWIYGDKTSSLDYINNLFDYSLISKTVNSYIVDYDQYVYNGPSIGFRRIRLYRN